MRNLAINRNNVEPLPPFVDEWQKGTPYSFSVVSLVIEFLSGDKRVKRNESGFTVAGIMPVAYGYILDTTDAHGEEIDMYLAPCPDPAADVYVIDQVNPGNGVFDEHKVMLGFSSIDEAVFVYTTVFNDESGNARAGKVTSMSPSVFSQWLEDEGSSLKPASDFVHDEADVTTLSGISGTARTNRDAPEVRDEAGGIIVDLPSVKQGPKIRTVIEDGHQHHHFSLYSGLDTEVWSNAIDTLVRMLDFADHNETIHIHIACPGGSVFLMGRVISAMIETKATVITYAEGSVASAATSIWAHGHQRHILPAAYFMQHMSSQLVNDKTTNIAAKANFCVAYIEKQLQRFVEVGLFTQEEVTDMSEKSADIYISGADAIKRVGTISGNVHSVEGMAA